MTTTMSKITFACTITKTSGILTILAPNGKDCKINLNLTDNAGLTSEEQSLVYGLEDEKTADLTAAEMRSLVSIREKTTKVNNMTGNFANKTVVATVAQTINRTNYGAGETAEERSIDRMVNAAKKLNEKISMLIYDIPVVKNGDCPNPSHILWHYGFRLNDSCWVLPESSLNSPRVQKLLEHWKHHNISTYIIPYAAEALAQIRAIANEKIREEIVRAHTSLITRIASADARLVEAIKALEEKEKEGQEVTAKDREKVDAYRDNTVRSIIRTASEHLEASIHCAERFDESENVEDLIAGLRQAIQASAAAFNASMRAKGSKPVTI